MESNDIIITGARENNLKNLSLQIPKNKITVITGPSGSGKSSLAFDTIHAESQWRFIENLSLSSHLFFKKLPRPNVDSITGLSPSLALKQGLINTANRDVGKFSDISNLLAVLFTRQASAICPSCNKEIKSYTAQRIVNLYTDKESKLEILAPTKLSSDKDLDELRESGIVRLKVEGEDYRLDEDEQIPLDKDKSFIVLDRIKASNSSRLFDSIEYAYNLSQGRVSLLIDKKELKSYNQNLYCCGNLIPEITPKTFLNLIEDTNFIKLDNYSFNQLNSMKLSELLDLIDGFNIDSNYESLRKQIIIKLKSLINIDLDSLSLNRGLSTLSSGQIQRLRLSAIHTSNLENILYVLDEPSAYLGKAEIKAVITLIKEIRAKNNTVIIVEHNQDIIDIADHLIEIGPDAGEFGGEVVYSGKVLKQKEQSASQKLVRRKTKTKEFLDIKSSSKSYKIPLSGFNVITGHSGSGKTSLLKKLSTELKETNKKIYDLEILSTNKSHRSNVATILEIHSEVRKLFSYTSDAKIRGFKPSRFSFNVKGGRCEDCSGTGVVKIEIDLLSDIYATCETCVGKRYNKETLSIKYKNLNINQVLELSLVEAAKFFKNIPKIYKKLSVATELGLGYLKLGQNSTCISGGELQRLKLCESLVDNFDSIYLLDEPTIGLNSKDIKNLIDVFDRLVAKNNLVICASQNEDLSNNADSLIKL